MLNNMDVPKNKRERAVKIFTGMDTEIGLVDTSALDDDGDGVDDFELPQVFNPHPATQLRPITAPKGFVGRAATSLEAAMEVTRPSNLGARGDLLSQRFEDRLTLLQLKMLERRTAESSLELGNAGVTLRHVRMLSLCLGNNPQISTLNLVDNGLEDEIAEPLVDALLKVGGITHLDLTENNFTHLGLQQLVRLLKVEEVGSYRTIEEVRRYQPDGSRSAALFFLGLQDNELNDEGAKVLASAVEENFQLHTLNISECQINEEGAVSLGWMLHENQSLQTINFAWNNLGSERAAKAIADGLRYNTTLTSVDLSHTGLRDNAGQFIADILEENDVILHLNLGGNALGEVACSVMAAALSKNSTLQTLDMSANPLGMTGATILLQAFSKSVSLTNVNLEKCSFMTNENSTVVHFDPDNPKGDYRLDLSIPLHYEVAESLVELWQEHGPKCWRKAWFDGKIFELQEDMHWPQRMPEKGILKVQCRPPTKNALEMRPLSDLEFENVFLEMDFRFATDQWKVSYVQLLSQTCYFTSEQAAEVIKIFQWPQDKVDATSLMFSRIVDPDNIHVLENACTPREWNAVLNTLGVLSRFHVSNLTNFYTLNLSRAVDRSIARRLQLAYSNEVLDGVSKGPKYFESCWRNVTLDNILLKPSVKDGEFMRLPIPHDGWIHIDYVSYRFPPKDSAHLDDDLFTDFLSIMSDKTIANDKLAEWYHLCDEWIRDGGETLQKKLRRRALRGKGPLDDRLVVNKSTGEASKTVNASMYAYMKQDDNGEESKEVGSTKIAHGEVDYDEDERQKRLADQRELTKEPAAAASVTTPRSGGNTAATDQASVASKTSESEVKVVNRPVQNPLEIHEVARDLLRAIEQFCGHELNVNDIHSWSKITIRSMSAGGFLAVQDTAADEAYFIISGHCEILKDYNIEYHTGGTRLSEVQEGDFVGELALFSGKPKRLSTAHCLTDLLCYVLPKDFLNELLMRNPDAAKKIQQKANKKIAGDTLEVALTVEQTKRADETLSAIRLLTIKSYVNCDQVEHLMRLKCFIRPSQRVTVLQACFSRIVDREHISDIMRNMLGPSGQMLAGEKLGWMNLYDPSKPGQLTYRLRLDRDDEYRVAFKLITRAVRGGGNSNIERVKVNGRFVRHPEDDNLWRYLRGELDKKRKRYTNVLEFYFASPSEDQDLTAAAIAVQQQWRIFSSNKTKFKTKMAAIKLQIFCAATLAKRGEAKTAVRDRWNRARINLQVKMGLMSLLNFLRQSYTHRSAFRDVYEKYWNRERLKEGIPDDSNYRDEDKARRIDGALEGNI